MRDYSVEAIFKLFDKGVAESAFLARRHTVSRFYDYIEQLEQGVRGGDPHLASHCKRQLVYLFFDELVRIQYLQWEQLKRKLMSDEKKQNRLSHLIARIEDKDRSKEDVQELADILADLIKKSYGTKEKE